MYFLNIYMTCSTFIKNTNHLVPGYPGDYNFEKFSKEGI